MTDSDSKAGSDSAADVDAFLGQPRRSRWRRWRKWIFIGIPLLIVLLLLARCFAPKPPVHYATAPVERQDLTVTITATGNLAPTVQVNVGSEESGLVDKVYVQNNDRVVKGQPLAQLDLSRLRDALVQSRATLQAALAGVAQNRATLAQTRANLARLAQVFKLSGGKVPSRTELDTARADYARAVANLAQAEAQVAQARASVSTNQTSLSKGTIYAPVTGVVLSRQVDAGQTVAASFNVATLFTIAEDLSRMKLQVKVDEADVGELHVGAPATFTVDAYPNQSFPASVTRVDLGANATPVVNSAGTTVAATTNVVAYTAELVVSNPNQLLKPGMTATASIVTQSVKNVLLVPNAALRFTPPAPVKKNMFGPPPEQPKNANVSRGARQQLWVIGADGNPRAIPVTIGHSNGTLTEVRGAGLRPGLQIITGQLAGEGK
jgi:HlyD family secretion protein